MSLVALHANFRVTGWRWPFRPGDLLEVWRDNELIAEISFELLASLVTHYLVGHDLVRQFDAASTRPGAGPSNIIRRPLVTMKARGPDRDARAELRARRRAR